MNNSEIIYRSLDFIEKNLRGSVSVNELSDHFGFSLYYFSRLFKGVTGHSPKSYITGRKMAESVDDLSASDKKIIEIAYDYGFATPESFSRAFQKVFGINPSDVRRGYPVDESRLLRPLKEHKSCENIIIPEYGPELVELGPLNLTGISIYDETCQIKDLTAPWQNLMSRVSDLSARIIPERYYQVQTWFDDIDPELIMFFIAVEVSDISELPIHFTAKRIPRQKYLRFFHRGFSGQVGKTYQYIYEKWLPQTDYKLPYLYNFEFYGDLYKGPCKEDSVSEIYIPVRL